MHTDEKNPLAIFMKSFEQVPAYRRVLEENGIAPYSIQTMSDFKTLPVIDKKSYIHKYPLKDLFPGRLIPPMAYASSGSSGMPTFWFRGDGQEEIGGELHEWIFDKIFNIGKNESTLVVILFAMGVWVAGNYTLSACRYLSRKGYQVSTITPGVEKEDISNILRDLSPEFKNLVLVGYPPFLMDVVNDVIRRGVRFNNKKIKIITAGDKFSEEWRDSILKTLNIKDGYRSLISIYGSADAAILGHETPLTIILRKAAETNQNLYNDLFGDVHTLPAIMQYHPEHIFFEAVDDELVLTADTAAPLIRYNIHDIGNVIDHEEMGAILKRNNIEQEARKYGFSQWRLPFVIIKGRSDVAVTFYALNIFPEHIKAGIEDKSISRYLSGNFLAYNKTVNKGKTQRLYIKLELAEGVRPDNKILELTQQSILKNLLKLNMEFRKLYSTIGQKALPLVNLCEHESGKFSPASGAKNLISKKGKKPRVTHL